MIMRQFLKSVWSFLECLGRARASAILARQGLHKEACDLMIKKVNQVN